MRRKPGLTLQERIRIDRLYDSGRLARAVGRKLGGIADVVLRYSRFGANYGTRSCEKRETKSSDRQERKIIQDARDGSISHAQMRDNNNLQVHEQTVRRVLKSASHMEFKRCMESLL